jgi:hypothetical protein
VNDNWTAAIPAQEAGTKIYYYIQGISETGKIQVRPLTAPEGRWNFTVLDTGTVTSVQEDILDKLFSVSAFPNPTAGLTCIPVFTPDGLSINLEVLDVTGRLVKQIYQGEISSGEARFYLQPGDLQSGIYLIRVQTRFGDRIQKLIVN